MLWFAYEETGYSRFLGSKSNNMSARRIDNGLITAIAIDKDKNSQHALKWAIENILVDSPHCVLLHVQPKGIACSLPLIILKQQCQQNSN